MNADLRHGDCRDLIAAMVDNSIDAIVTDPPYEIGFMGKGWDGSGIAHSVEMWAECLRVLKPGGHLLAFGATRTYHRMTAAIEDAGFEIRDSIHWLYGSGFPKSLDVSKTIDKAAGHWRGKAGKVVSANGTMSGPNYERTDKGDAVTAAAAAAAGWGTALKPAHEPIVVARKPLVGTVAANVLEHGTGALNIDGCRVAATTGDEPLKWKTPRGGIWRTDATATATATFAGRWPANVITDGSIEAEWVRYFYCAKPSKAERDAGLNALPEQEIHRLGAGLGEGADPSAPAINRNTHPTVKPLTLMRYLVRLVTPPGGTVLEPFAGSGTTMAAAILEGFNVIGCELTDDYLPIINGRVAWAQQEYAKAHDNLFGDTA